MPQQFASNRSTIRSVALCLVALISAYPLQAFAASEDTDTRVVFWQSTDSEPTQLARQFDALYRGLYSVMQHGATFPTRVVTAANNDSPERIMRKHDLYYGEGFRPSASLFLCRLNERVCSASGNQAVWAIKENDPIVLPDIDFERILHTQRVRKPADVPLEKLLAENSTVCRRVDASCKKALQNLNPGIPHISDRYQGWLEVPTTSFRATIPITVPKFRPKGAKSRRITAKPDSRDSSIVRQSEVIESTGVSEHDAVDPDRFQRDKGPIVAADRPAGHRFDSNWAAKSQSTEPMSSSSLWEAQPNRAAAPVTDSVVWADLPPNAIVLPTKQISAIAAWHAESLPEAPTPTKAEGDRTTILRLINHPFAVKAPLGSTTSVDVAFIDEWVFAKHCLFDAAHLKVLNSADPDSSLLPVAHVPCGQRAEADIVRDHGTHMVGIVGARRDAPTGPGVDPQAFIKTIQIDPDSFVDPLYVSKVVEKLSHLLIEDGSPRIFNLSFSYQPRVDTTARSGASVDLFADFIRDNPNRIFVAAGSEKLGTAIGRPRSCTVRPVCIDLPNVITVAPTNLIERPSCPSLLPNANHGSGIDLAAPGENVVSSIAGDRTGMLSGSSQAAPLVTGALSLLMGQDVSMRARTAANRLIYTGDQCESLDVYGGRLNVLRALSYKHASLRLKQASVVEMGFIHNPTLMIKFAEPGSATYSPFRVSLAALKRMTRLPSDYYVIIYHDQSPNDESSPLRRRVVTVESGPGMISYDLTDENGKLSQDKHALKFDVTDLDDYIAPINELMK